MTVFANEYLNVFTTGFHYAFGVAILAMVLSLVIFVINRKKFPDPSKKVAAKAGDATAVEMSAQEVRQRIVCRIRCGNFLLVLVPSEWVDTDVFCQGIYRFEFVRHGYFR